MLRLSKVFSEIRIHIYKYIYSNIRLYIYIYIVILCMCNYVYVYMFPGYNNMLSGYDNVDPRPYTPLSIDRILYTISLSDE